MYPFTLLGTWFHEMGHGITSILVGGTFVKLEIFNNGSGLAHSSYTDFYLRQNIALAIVSAAGLMGPPVMGSILILMSKSFKKSTIILYVLSIVMALSVILWVRTGVGIVTISLLAGLFFLIAYKAGDRFKQLAVQIIGLQACLSTYLQISYLYTEKVSVGGNPVAYSDTGSIAQNLGGTYWIWGTLIGLAGFTLLITSLYYRFRSLKQ